MTSSLQQLDLQYPRLKRYWKVEVQTDHSISPRPKPRPPQIFFDLGSGCDGNGYTIYVDSVYVYLWGGNFGLRNGTVDRKELDVGKPKMFCDDSKGQVVVKITRVS